MGNISFLFVTVMILILVKVSLLTAFKTELYCLFFHLICCICFNHLMLQFLAHWKNNWWQLLNVKSDTTLVSDLLRLIIHLTAALSHLNQAQLVWIQKFKWMKAYIQTQSDICNYQNIESAWCEAGLFLCNPQRALCMLAWETTSEAERSKTSTQFNIFDQVFVNSSSSDEATLQTANKLLNSTIEGCTISSTPVCQYIWKLAFETEQLWAWSIVHQHDAKNLWSILKKQKTHVKRKRVVLKGHFYISTQELCDAVVEAEKTTKY